MRWGISHELTNTHCATKVCIDEIKNCKKNSVGPNFIVKKKQYFFYYYCKICYISI